jgi:2-iminobutanoate/2-iminopropanoate deaminase
MPKRIVATDRAPKAIGPYSQAVLVERPGDATLHCAGQIPIDPATGELVPGDFRAQAERVMQNIEGLLRGASMGWGDVVQSTVYLVDLADLAAMNEVYAGRFAGAFPARSTVQVAALPRGARIEIEVLARRDAPDRAARRLEPRPAARKAARPPRRKTARPAPKPGTRR